MKLTQTVVQKFFTVIHKGKTYYIDYVNSDDAIILGNRDYWEVLDEELEEISPYIIGKSNKQAEKNVKLYYQLVEFCIEHFDDYQPDYKEDC